jgi:hypothetical protein
MHFLRPTSYLLFLRPASYFLFPYLSAHSKYRLFHKNKKKPIGIAQGLKTKKATALFRFFRTCIFQSNKSVAV